MEGRMESDKNFTFSYSGEVVLWSVKLGQLFHMGETSLSYH